MPQFHHIGLPTTEKQPNEVYVPDTKVWVTSPDDHPYRVEYLRYEPDSPITGPLRDMGHIAFTCDDLDAQLEGQEIVLEPFVPIEGLTVAFILKDGAVFEYMKFD